MAINPPPIAKPTSAPPSPLAVIQLKGKINAPLPIAEPNAIAKTHDGLKDYFSDSSWAGVSIFLTS